MNNPAPATFTPGPWFAHHGWVHHHDITKEHPHWCEVTAEGHTPDGYALSISGHFGMANARLIAAAPCMLTALEQIECDVSRILNFEGNQLSSVERNRLEEAYNMVAAAIAKATGA